jgi:hypothetical protein
MEEAYTPAHATAGYHHYMAPGSAIPYHSAYQAPAMARDDPRAAGEAFENGEIQRSFFHRRMTS